MEEGFTLGFERFFAVVNTLKGVVFCAGLKIDNGLGGNIIAKGVLAGNHKSRTKIAIRICPSPSATRRHMNSKIPGYIVKSITIASAFFILIKCSGGRIS